MPKQKGTHALKVWMVVPVLWPAGMTMAADAPKPQAQEGLELEEVLVEGRKPEADRRKLIAWIDRLVGHFSYEGYVEQRSADGAVMNRAEIDGATQCHRFGRAVAVQCLVNASWPEMRGPDGKDVPGGVSSLTPAVAVYSLDHAKMYIGHLQVDGEGVAVGGKGWILDDTLISRSPCADFPGNCVRVLRMEAPPDGKVVRMRVDLERDGRLAVRYSFQWNRLSQAQMAEAPLPVPLKAPSFQVVAPRAGAATIPPVIDSWLRRLVGKFHVRTGQPCSAMEGKILSGDDLMGPALNKEVDCSGDEPDEPVMTRNRPAEAECESIGAGPGVRCVLYMAWPETGVRASKRASMKLNPSYMLYGFDPVLRGISLVDVVPTADAGPAGFATGRIQDDKLTYEAECARPPCNGTMNISFPLDGEKIRWTVRSVSRQPSERTPYVFQLSWDLRRVPERESANASEPRKAPTNPSPRRQ